MPELPEVETIARGVDERLRGDRIETTWFSGKPEPFKSSPQLMAKELPGRRIERVHRVGKHIVFDLEDGKAPILQWIVHLGMTGRLLVADAETPVPAHTHGILHLASGRELRFVDARRFGRMELHGIPTKKTTHFTGTGQEPFNISKDEFAALFRPRRTSIKAALLNQKLLHGVGNIYADESLFRAGIRPRRMALHLKRAELDRLHTALQTVLRTMWMPPESKASSNSSIGSTCGLGSPVWFAGTRFAGSLWPAGELTIVRTANARFYEFQNDCPGKASINRNQEAS
jgi:formamidopyrimidine-DNA glycosylase